MTKMPSIANAKKQRNLCRVDCGVNTAAVDQGDYRTEPDNSPEIVDRKLKSSKSEPRLATPDTKCFSISPKVCSGKDNLKEEILLNSEENESVVPSPVPTPLPYRNPVTAAEGGPTRTKSMSQFRNKSFGDLKQSSKDDMEKPKRCSSKKHRKKSEKLERRSSVSGISVSSSGIPTAEEPETQTKIGEAQEKSGPKLSESAQDTGPARRFANVFAEACPGEVGIWDCAAAFKHQGKTLRGRLYLSDKSVCFCSPFSKKLTVLPFTTITRIVRGKWAALPNAIRVACTDGNRYIFLSMVSRNQCYAEMLQLCQKCNPSLSLAALMGGEDDESAGTDGENSIGTLENGEDDEAGPVECGCKDHYSKKFIDTVLGVPAEQLFDIMFGDNSTFTQDYAGAAMGYTNYTASPWAVDSASQTQKRVVTFSRPLKKNPIGLKAANVEDTQTLERKTDSKLYVVTSESRTPKMPYGDSMVTCNRFCITWQSRKSCRLFVTSDIIFKKSILGPIKYAIVKSSLGIMEESHNIVLTSIETYLGGHPPQLSNNTTTTAEIAEPQETVEGPKSVVWRPAEQQAKAYPVLTILMALTVLLSLLYVARSLANLQEAVDRLAHAIRDINL